ncbi:MAG: hypothetical protein IID42_09305 [Planctomycetes bacterium]|nr:hypothetical protein [Planctomycetota bacterium]
MSDNWLILIPEAAGFVPAIAAAKVRFRSFLPDADEIEADVSSRLKFIDCGSNFEHVYCPHTGKEIDCELWSEAMAAAYESEFENLCFVSPHSGKPTSLDDLVYDWPQGFACFALEAMNPGIKDLSRECLRELEELLGCRLKVIWQHL